MTADWLVPGYDQRALGALLPGAAAALGHDLGRPAVSLPAAERICVVVVDGLGHRMLLERPRAAPFLSTLMDPEQCLVAGAPSTTATSMASFGTGLPPGRHGLVGYEVMDPDRGELLNELRWHPDTDPLRWQPHPTVFQELAARGVPVTQIGNPEFYGSGLTEAALRGATFVGLTRLRDRVDAAVDRLREPGLVYLYWADVDSVGHVHGWRSAQWRRTVRALDRELARLSRCLPSGTLLVITADHGMVDVPHAERLDLAAQPGLWSRFRVLGGEGRFAQLYCEPGTPADRVADLARQLADWIGERAHVCTRVAAIDAGWFGPVEERVRPRLGEVIVAGREPFTLIDSRTARPHTLSLIGQHGSLTPDEQLVPFLRSVS
ncbi:alkaline phosphatase family protein [Nakamurella multipartita]|uniref:Type I phosphodiesterase/nucleotide pyrophosphatase n=1 Tax=Nakamurella multipartita (strain ATCC 700099 / DSM 44233 / CIP 104796 / JCM 9543 / NBRC 105858 / Y-104) TaxID=479431 RepID=C8XIF7_NAKMY|nr:nucleotide pyrophosphatase/phosphodiesterase family protein [Nakamurella multipartita]ACV80422.1 type I phosphodiesterase/nucleotide pyrophosphatase [Nakamurella multipartita DSM 44233]